MNSSLEMAGPGGLAVLQTNDSPVNTIRWHLLPNTDAVATTAAKRILAAAETAISQRGQFKIVLAGGGTPKATYQKLVKAKTDWANWFIYFGDERCLAANDPQRNSAMAASAWLDRVDIPRQQIFPIAAELGATIAAQRYGEMLGSAVPFDVVLLGIGEDGHTASLFPGHVHAEDQWAVAVHNAPKPPSDRVSLTVKALRDTRECYVLITGQGKKEALRQWRRGKELPIAQATCNGADVFLETEVANVPQLL